MGKCIAVLVALVAVVVGVCLFVCLSPPPDPPEMQDGWFGPGKPKPETDESIRQFKINIPDAVLKDLQHRLNNTRLTPELEDSVFHYGFRAGYMKEVLSYWRDKYDWRKHEAILNSFPQFQTTIEGMQVYFIRAKPPKGVTSRPLLLLHGWPSSVWDFYKILPMLTNPEKYGGSSDVAFEVIAPSIPGFCFSEAPKQKGFNAPAAARVFHKLMTRLGHKKYYIQGGDWGGMVGTVMAQAYPSHVTGFHTNFILTPMSGMVVPHQIIASFLPSLFLGEEKKKWDKVGGLLKDMLEETGYLHIQATKPDTIGMALNDSPIGLAGYILEKFSTGTNPDYRDRDDGGLTEKFTLDELLTSVMIYWVTGTITSSQRFYKEWIRSNLNEEWDRVPVTVPSGLAAFPNELLVTPFKFAAYRYVNMVQATDMPRGGHFAALEEPELLARGIWEFVQKVERL